MYSRRRSFKTVSLGFVFCIIAATAVTVVVAALSKGVVGNYDSRAIVALEEEGYTDIKLERTYFFTGCGKDDSISYIAYATNAKGRRVELLVCMGYWKGVTIRHR